MPAAPRRFNRAKTERQPSLVSRTTRCTSRWSFAESKELTEVCDLSCRQGEALQLGRSSAAIRGGTLRLTCAYRPARRQSATRHERRVSSAFTNGKEALREVVRSACGRGQASAHIGRAALLIAGEALLLDCDRGTPHEDGGGSRVETPSDLHQRSCRAEQRAEYSCSGSAAFDRGTRTGFTRAWSSTAALRK